MRISCKLSNTAISYIEAEGLDPTDFLIELPWSASLLSDPGQTLPIAEMESFFNHFINWWKLKKGPLDDTSLFLRQVGQSSFEFRTWGTLDSVLRMMPDVFEVWQRPSKLLGHFVDPEPVVKDLHKDRKCVRFMWPSAPHFSVYSFQVLLGSIEVLPKYMGASFASCYFDQGYFCFDLAAKQVHKNMLLDAKIDGLTNQALRDLSVQTQTVQMPTPYESMGYYQMEASKINEATASSVHTKPLSGGAPLEVALSNGEALFHSLSLSPEAFREMVAVVEKPLRPKRKAKNKSDVQKLEGPEQLTLHASFAEPESESVLSTHEADLDSLQQNLSRIVDFFVRSTQLVKLIAQHNPNEAKMWMRRLNWDKVQEEFPSLVEESVTLVKQLKSPNRNN